MECPKISVQKKGNGVVSACLNGFDFLTDFKKYDNEDDALLDGITYFRVHGVDPESITVVRPEKTSIKTFGSTR